MDSTSNRDSLLSGYSLDCLLRRTALSGRTHDQTDFVLPHRGVYMTEQQVQCWVTGKHCICVDTASKDSCEKPSQVYRTLASNDNA